jgi:hypothetical protein
MNIYEKEIHCNLILTIEHLKNIEMCTYFIEGSNFSRNFN